MESEKHCTSMVSYLIVVCKLSDLPSTVCLDADNVGLFLFVVWGFFRIRLKLVMLPGPRVQFHSLHPDSCCRGRNIGRMFFFSSVASWKLSQQLWCGFM